MNNVLKDSVGNILNPIIPRYEKKFSYFFNEVIVGKWKDGRPVYKKTIPFTINKTSNESRTAHNIENIDFAIIYEGFFHNDNETRFMPQVYHGSEDYTFSLYSVTATQLIFNYGNGVKNLTGYEFFVTLYYVKKANS